MVEREAAVALEDQAETRVFECPECHEKFPTAEDLGVHIEKHRPSMPAEVSRRGKPLTFPCPKGCGRNFPYKTHAMSDSPEIPTKVEITAHIESCDGSAPLPMGAPKVEREEATVAKSELDCPKCGKKYDRGGHYRDLHIDGCDGKEQATRKPRRTKAAAGEGPEPLVVPDTSGNLAIKERILGLLEVEEERLEKELGNCKALIAAVREAGADEGRPT